MLHGPCSEPARLEAHADGTGSDCKSILKHPKFSALSIIDNADFIGEPIFLDLSAVCKRWVAICNCPGQDLGRQAEVLRDDLEKITSQPDAPPYFAGRRVLGFAAYLASIISVVR